MDFRTTLTPQKSSFKLNHQQKILSFGSCFASNIGDKLYENKFQILKNPFGVIFNPISIFKLLESSLKSNISIFDDFYLDYQDAWYNYLLHSEIFDSKKENLIEKIKDKITRINQQKTDVLILTFGTAWVYKLSNNQQIVANCHKQASKLFEKQLLSIEEIKECFLSTYTLLKEKNPHVKITLTVSPVRHLKDTLELNSVSKSVLRLASYQITQEFEDVYYFPSYELLLDDLRDYRFYKKDMLHPSEEAIDYIWEKFKVTFFSTETLDILEKWEKIKKAINHKAFQPNSESHQNFLKNTLKKLQNMKEYFDIKQELEDLSKRIR